MAPDTWPPWPPRRHLSATKSDWHLGQWISRGRRAKRNGRTEQQDPTKVVRVASANVNTLWPEEVRQLRRDGAGDFASEKILRLDREFHAAGYEVVGIQESRISESIDVKNENYRVIGAGASIHGNLGVQLWFSRALQVDILEIVPLSPRLLFVAAGVCGHIVIFASIHAPINDSIEAASFYSQLPRHANVLKSKYPNSIMIFLCDLNAKVGSVGSPNIGSVQPDIENDNGAFMRVMLAEIQLAAVNTYFEAGPTWTGTRGAQHRIDFILVSISILPNIEGCKVNRNIELAESERDDHSVLEADVQLPARATHPISKSSGPRPESCKLCPRKLQDPCLQKHFAEHVWSFHVSDETAVDEHLTMLQQHLRDGKRLFIADRRTPKKRWISEETWQRMSDRSEAKKHMRKCMAYVRASNLSIVFLAWAACRPCSFMRHHGYSDVILGASHVKRAYVSWANATMHYSTAQELARKAIRNDKAVFLDAIAAEADAAADHGDNKALYRLSQKALCERAAEVKVVKCTDGTLTASDEQYARRMQEHFCDVFGAAIVDNLEALGVKQPDVPYGAATACPDAEQIERTIAKQPLGKACGEDEVPIELIKAGGGACASKLWDLLRKVWRFAYWPMSWRGGRLKELHKKGDTKECDNYRGLLIGDHMGKVGAALLNDAVDEAYHGYVPESQCGAVKKKGSDFATHLLRTMMDYAAANQLSIAILFVDLTKAFDLVLREVVLGWPQLPGIKGIEYLEELGFPADHARQLAAEIASDGCVFDEIRIHPHVRELVASMHTKSWFHVPGCSERLVTRKGSRQGCRFGGTVFNLLYAKALKRYQAALLEENIPARLRYTQGAPCVTRTEETAPDGDAIVLDVTFVDDEAVIVTASVPITLSNHFRRAVQLLVETFERYGMVVNFKPGKTEVIAVFRGTGAVAQRAAIVHDDSSRTLRVRRVDARTGREDLDIIVNVVDQYKHLGSIIDSSNNLVPEARRRASAAMNSFGPMSMRVFGQKSIHIKRRINLGWSLVISRLTFNVHIWSAFDGKPKAILNHVYMRLWRRIAGDPRFGRTTWSDIEIRQWLDVPSLSCYMRRRRLMYLSRLARVEFIALHAALQAKTRTGAPLPWIKLLIQDLQVLRQHLPRIFEDLPAPDVDITPYWTIARDCPAEWRSIVSKYNDHSEDLPTAISEPQKAAIGSMACTCRICKRVFPDASRLGRHMYAKHRVKSEVRRYIGDISVCPICGTDFRSRDRLAVHLMNNATSKHRTVSCRNAFLQQKPIAIEHSSLLRIEARDAKANSAARKLGQGREKATKPCHRTLPWVHKGKSLRPLSLSSARLSSGRSTKRTFSMTSSLVVQPGFSTKARRLSTPSLAPDASAASL